MNMTNLTKAEKAVLYALWHAGGTIKKRTKADWSEWEEHLPLQLHRQTIRNVVDSLVTFRKVAVAEIETGPKQARRQLRMVRLNDSGFRWVEREQQVFPHYADQYALPYEQRPTGKQAVTALAEAEGTPPHRAPTNRVDFLRWFWTKYEGQTSTGTLIGLSREFNGSKHAAQSAKEDGLLDVLVLGGKRVIQISDTGLDLLAAAPVTELPEPELPDEPQGAAAVAAYGAELLGESPPELVVDASAVAGELLAQVIRMLESADEDASQLGAKDDAIKDLIAQLAAKERTIDSLNVQVNELRGQIDTLVSANEDLEEALRLAQDANAQRVAESVASESYLNRLAQRINKGTT